MLDAFRQYVEAGLGALPKDRAMELAQQMLAQGAGLLEQGQSLVGHAPGGEQIQRLARDLMSWSRTSGERLREMVQEQVKKQVKGMGLATREDVDALRRRIRELESGGQSRAAAGRSRSAKKASAKRASAKATAKRASPKRASPKRATGTKATATKATAKRRPARTAAAGRSTASGSGGGA